MASRNSNNRERLRRENCNKAMCATCIFQTNGQAIELSPERKDEILRYLALGEASHVCHTTNLTCYGALEFQAQVFYNLHIIPEPTVNSLLNTAAKILGFEQEGTGHDNKAG